MTPLPSLRLRSADQREYRRGMVLGLTMAEIAILLIFLLMLAAAAASMRRGEQSAAEARINQQRIEQAERQRDLALRETGNDAALLRRLDELSERNRALVAERDRLAADLEARSRAEGRGIAERMQELRARLGLNANVPDAQVLALFAKRLDELAEAGRGAPPQSRDNGLKLSSAKPKDEPSEGLRICQERRSALLLEIQARLRSRRVENATIDTASGVLRLNERALYFEPRVDSLPSTGPQREVIRAVADVFAELLPCITAGGPRPATCRPGEEAIIDAVFVEGHTDRRPFRLAPDGKDENYGLSARRALNVYELMKRDQPRLWELMNREQFAIMGMSGYGPERPVPGRIGDTQEDWAANRRIEFRFLLDPLPCSRLSSSGKEVVR